METRFRRNGKSALAKLWAEAMLAAGKRVAFVTPEKTEIHKRHKHLTSIETIDWPTPKEPDNG